MERIIAVLAEVIGRIKKYQTILEYLFGPEFSLESKTTKDDRSLYGFCWAVRTTREPIKPLGYVRLTDKDLALMFGMDDSKLIEYLQMIWPRIASELSVTPVCFSNMPNQPN